MINERVNQQSNEIEDYAEGITVWNIQINEIQSPSLPPQKKKQLMEKMQMKRNEVTKGVGRGSERVRGW